MKKISNLNNINKSIQKRFLAKRKLFWVKRHVKPKLLILKEWNLTLKDPKKVPLMIHDVNSNFFPKFHWAFKLFLIVIQKWRFKKERSCILRSIKSKSTQIWLKITPKEVRLVTPDINSRYISKTLVWGSQNFDYK